MKACFTIFLMCLATSLFSQTGAECSANAGPDQIICYNQPMVLDAPVSLDYNNPPGIQWSTSSAVGFSNPNDYTTTVTPGPDWSIGTYTFQFCARCKDLNGDGTNDQVCDEVVVTVTPEPTEPTIIEPDGTQDGQFTVCSEADITVSTPGAGEISSVSIFPDDGLVVATITGTTVHLDRLDTNSPTQGECTYEISYFISNGGCSKRAAVKATFIQPQDPNNDGIIEGHINSCPSCTNTLYLQGDRPGCGGQGAWSMIAGPAGATAVFEGTPNLATGDATMTVSLPGIYTFQYTVTNIAPCANSVFTITCNVLQIGSFSLGNSVVNTYCDNIAPAGVYSYTFNPLSNALFSWQIYGANSSQVGVTQGANSSFDITLFSDLDLSNGPVYVAITATKYFMDPDCKEGPLPIREVVLPYNDPVLNEAYIQSLLNTPSVCIYTCTTTTYVYFVGAPKLNIQSEDIYFLCSDGTETVKLKDYFTVTNGVGYSTNITVVSQPAGSNLPTTVTQNDLLNLSVDDCGEFIFEIEVKSYNYNVVPPLICTTTGFLTITIEESKPVTAGTDQIKCCNEPIRLNGNDPFNCGAVGTWSLVSCSSGCTVTIVDPHDPNTQIYVNEDCSNMPVTLDLKWSFSSQDPSCDLSDITQVTVNNCITPCTGLEVTVVSECIEGTIVFTALDNNGFILNPNVYTIIWTIDGSPYAGNPVSIVYPGHSVAYSVDVTLIFNNERVCFDNASGTANCVQPPSGCGIWIRESCDECGNVILTAVDAYGNTVPPTWFVHHFRWVVYSGPGDNAGVVYNSMNPITVHPGACYSLLYENFTYPPGSTPIPGTWIDYCRLEVPKTCVTITCPGPCQNFPDFFIAGCGDALDVSLGLIFPAGCHNVCGSSYSGSGTLGVFHTSTGLPVTDFSLYNIVWENGATGTYVNGTFNNINSVTITSKTNPCCFWKDAYTPTCCDRVPQSIQCEQPIVKHCYDDGTVTYTPGAPQITWIGVAGATGYELEITLGNVEGCCEGESVIETIIVAGSPWVFPDNYDCFTIRIKAIFPEGTCEGSGWSSYYTYCEKTMVCSPVIIVCGCCQERSAEGIAIPTQVVSEEELLAYLKAHPGQGYSTLQDALTATGLGTFNQPLFTVYPNPVSDVITIQPGSANQGAFQVELYDMLQRQWQKMEFESGTEGTLDVSKLSNGIYLLSIRNANGDLIQTEKITILR